MKILVVLNYYYPYLSGVSEVARLVAEKLVEEGNYVTVLTSNYNDLTEKEFINGVEVLRQPVWFKISKGVISPKYITEAIRLSKEYDIVNLHLPMIESGIISCFIDKRKILPTYQCDVNLTPNLINYFITKCMDMSNYICLRNATRIIVSSIDYARSSRIADKFMNKLVETAMPPKDYTRVDMERGIEKVIGFCGRIVEEKGIQVLLEAFAIIQKKEKDIKLLLVGEYEKVAGGSIYKELVEYIRNNNLTNVEFLGSIKEEEMESFFSSIDVLAFPSINSLEAYGLVQVEAMLCGTPVVASNLPGVRTIIQNTSMGEIVEVGNSKDLAENLLKVIENPNKYQRTRDEIVHLYGKEIVLRKYIKVIESMVEYV